MKPEKEKSARRSFGDVMRSPLGGFIIIAIFGLGMLFFYPENNIFTYIGTRREMREQMRQMEEYKQKIIEMDARIRRLTSDRDTLEQFARERFHFAAPGEDVYLIEP